MKFERLNLKREGVRNIQKGNQESFKEKVFEKRRSLILLGILALGSSPVALWYGNKFIPTDYTESGSFNQAFSKALKDGKKRFTWKGKGFTTELVDRGYTKNIEESKTFLRNYYSSNAFKSKVKGGRKSF